jgi:cell fate regulator YaaT (PSP1 superfamily)
MSGFSADVAVTSRVEDLIPVVVDPDLPAMPCRTGALEVRHDTHYLVETPDGQFIGRVSLFSLPVFRKRQGQIGRIIRLASAEDQKRSEDTRHIEREIESYLRRRTRELGLDMRPLGVRDGARVCGGLGPCGRCLCCATFMDRFHSVTVRMAKRQKLSLNPTKISGLCGRLMCCLAHEVDQYPDLGKRPRRRN